MNKARYDMLRLLLDKGADRAPVRWVRIWASGIPAARVVLRRLAAEGLVTVVDPDAGNPGFRFTDLGADVARRASR
jgi:hypothetical protein